MSDTAPDQVTDYKFEFSNAQAVRYAVEALQAAGASYITHGLTVTVTASGYRSEFGQSFIRLGDRTVTVALNAALERVSADDSQIWPALPRSRRSPFSS